MAISYQVAVKTSGSSEYTTNGVYLPDMEQATAYATDIARRWSAYVDHQVRSSEQQPNYVFLDGRLQQKLPEPVAVVKVPPVKKRQKMRRIRLYDSERLLTCLVQMFGQQKFADWYEKRFVPIIVEESEDHPEAPSVKQELKKLVKQYIK